LQDFTNIIEELNNNTMICCMTACQTVNKWNETSDYLKLKFLRSFIDRSFICMAYKKSIGTKMNDLDLCLEVVSGHA